MRRMHRPILAVLALLLLVGVSTLSAQRPQARQGFWFNLGLGWGTLGCQDCDGREGGGAAALALGGTLNQKWQLGGGAYAWAKEEDGVTLAVSLTAFVAKFYPSATGGFHLLGGLGFASVDLEIDGFGDASESGSGLILGLGYDFRVGRNVSLTPFWNGVATSYDGGDLNFGQLGLGITIH